MKPLISIVIRSKNEERWIKPCLSAIRAQSLKDFEVILVDNQSTDGTVRKAEQWGVKKIIPIEKFLPGKAINLGVDAAEGEFIVLISAHCIPTDSEWLANLYKNFAEDKEEKIAGVYGRQEPLSFTDDLDKRDLIITFGLDRRIQVKDSFFHNANSMVRKSVLSKIPFDSTVTNIEDRVWGKAVIEAGLQIVYEPSASVYHHHGIHQSANRKRAKNIVRIIESLQNESASTRGNLSLLNYQVAAVILARGAPEAFAGKTLLEYAIRSAKESKNIHQVFVSTDNEETRDLAIRCGARVPFLRPAELSAEGVGVEKVLEHFVSRLEEIEELPDLFVYLSTRHPFRKPHLLDWLVELQVAKGFDSVMPGLPTYKSCWRQEGDELRRMDEGFIAREKKQPIHVAYAGLGCVTYTDCLREGKLLGDKVGILEALDQYSVIEVSPHDRILAEKVFPEWWKTHHPHRAQDEMDETSPYWTGKPGTKPASTLPV